MLLFLSSWNQTLVTEDQELDVPNHLGAIMAKVGLGITVSSLTSSIAFSLGYLSSSLVVANFCIFAGIVHYKNIYYDVLYEEIYLFYIRIRCVLYENIYDTVQQIIYLIMVCSLKYIS